uniref:Uncharacterized protein n=1 Tax=Anopheles quadriannulatus TaxID=34691 RepID=A0A182XSS6_ANOQN
SNRTRRVRLQDLVVWVVFVLYEGVDVVLHATLSVGNSNGTHSARAASQYAAVFVMNIPSSSSKTYRCNVLTQCAAETRLR